MTAAMQRTGWLCTLALCLLATASRAQATEGPTVRQAKVIAYKAFPNVCTGQLIVTPDASLLARGLDEEATGRVFTNGYWQTTACTLSVTPGLTRERRCDVIVHGLGHLAGIDAHTPTGIMRAGAGYWPPCHPQQSRRIFAENAIRSMLPYRLTWRIQCDKRVIRCVALPMVAHKARHFVVGDGEVTVADPLTNA